MKRILISIFLALVIVMNPFTVEKYAFASILNGEGTEQSPFIIETYEDLWKIQNNPSAFYKLNSDITGEGITKAPMQKFEGVLDGAGFTIKNMNIDSGIAPSNGGLFMISENATIKNITFENVNVKGHKYTGSLIGEAKNTNINNVHIKSGSISDSNQSAGGIIGVGTNTTIKDSSNNASISSANWAGGIMGSLWSNSTTGNIERCFTSSDITAPLAGGIVGYTPYANSSIVIADCYSTATLNGQYVSGIVNNYSSKVTIKNNYFVGYLHSSIGLSEAHPLSFSATKINSYFNSETTGKTTPTNQAKTEQELKTKETFLEWDFDNVWAIEEGVSYPIFKTMEEPIIHPLSVLMTTGQALQLIITDKLSDNAYFNFTSSNENIANVDATGKVKALKKGFAIISATKNNDTFNEHINVIIK